MAATTFLDRAIGWISPAAGVRRLRDRVTMDVLARGYEGAAKGRLSASWRTPSTSADAEIAIGGRLLRDRMRDLVRNNPYVANAISVLVTHAVGDGIVPRTKDARVNALFADWSRQCDADGSLDFYGIQTLCARQMFEAGEGLVRRRRRRAADGLEVPLQLQVLEPDLIDSTKDGPRPDGIAVQGVEFDALGCRRSYWLFGAHPGGPAWNLRGGIQSRAVPAEDIAHMLEKQRSQVRGAPWGAPGMTSAYDLATYEQAEIVRKKLEACHVGVVIGGDDDDDGGPGMPVDTGTDAPGVYDVRGALVEKFAPGMFYHARGGKDVRFNQPAATGSYDAYKNSMLHTIAAGWRVPHSLLSGRLDSVNYSSSKVGLEGFKRTISAVQWQIIIPMLCEPVWQWFLEAAYFAGRIDHMDHPAQWSPPRFYSADPGRDVRARLMEVRSGFKSLPEAIAETGYNPDEVLEEIAAANTKLDKHGLVLDSDPRRVSQAGQIHDAPSSDGEDKNDRDDEPKDA